MNIYKKHFGKFIKNFFLILFGLLSIFPFLWIISTSFKGVEEIFSYPPTLIPHNFNFSNYIEVWKATPLDKYFANSLLIAFICSLLNVIIASMAGFALAKINHKHKKFFFLLILAAMLAPREAIVIPLYVIVLNLGWADTLLGASVPVAIEAMSIIMMRNAFLAIPEEIREAAIIDGCNTFQIFRKVMLPMTIPTLTTVCLFSFIGSWGDFLWPIIILKSQDNYTLQVGLSYMLGTFTGNFKFVAAGSVLALLPIIFLFIFSQKYFEKGLFAGFGK